MSTELTVSWGASGGYLDYYRITITNGDDPEDTEQRDRNAGDTLEERFTLLFPATDYYVTVEAVAGGTNTDQRESAVRSGTFTTCELHE